MAGEIAGGMGGEHMFAAGPRGMMHPLHSRIFCDALAAHSRAFAAVAELEQSFGLAAELCRAAIANGNCIMLCGNGGSAADAQHAAAELTGRFRRERRGLPAVALTTDTSALTAIGNDYGFEQVFARQVEAL